MNHLFDALAQKFDTISLQDLNEQAALLDREENKYVLTLERFFELGPELIDNFHILKIGDDRVFEYRTLYFDTDDLIGYTYHHQNRIKRRFKIRTRHYVNSGLCFFEVKLKSKRGGTIKKRIDYAIENFNTVTDEARHFLNTTYQQVYGLPFTQIITPKLEVNCSRITLVHNESSERLTIDFNLRFALNENTSPPKSLVIMETKSLSGRGVSDTIFKLHGIRSRSCSKYCLGVNLLHTEVKYNRFKPLLKLYKDLPFYDSTNVAKECHSVNVR